MKKAIIYTESAKSKLDSVLLSLKQKIEDEIRNSKDYPGEESIEITASDIEKINNNIIFIKPSRPYLKVIKIVLPLYFVMGLAIMFYGLFYEQIQSLLYKNPIRLVYILAGFSFSLLSSVMFVVYRQRDYDRQKEIERQKYRMDRKLEES